MHAAVDRRNVVMLGTETAFPFDSCCGELDVFNPETAVPTVTPGFYLVKIRPSWRAFSPSLI